jgi:hypothetical protein
MARRRPDEGGGRLASDGRERRAGTRSHQVRFAVVVLVAAVLALGVDARLAVGLVLAYLVWWAMDAVRALARR